MHSQKQGKAPVKQVLPQWSKCTLCSEKMEHAVLLACCGYSFCDECTRGHFLDSVTKECPKCAKVTTEDTIMPNHMVRDSIASIAVKVLGGL